MPEGPSLFIVKENIAPFIGKKIISANGNAKIDFSKLQGKKIHDIRLWGKQLFIIVKDVTLRIHFLMFGSYSVNEQTKPEKSVRLHIVFKKGEIFFYTCAVRELEGDLDELYDWEADVLSEKWNPTRARKKLKKIPGTMVCDALLDQQVFSGVGNIIKNEVLYRIFLHPETLIGNIPPRKLTLVINEARNYSFDFLKWKRAYVLKKHWLAHTKKTCKRCDLPFIKKYCGISQRRTFYCENCQVKYE
ncbi:MAG TPA: DNA-formamidopyrimidine glycosylase family protein [Flavitalea sp.]|nr:DNA-formamidopyrimidine glycosylase family protein [Flavitalea sp.]